MFIFALCFLFLGLQFMYHMMGLEWREFLIGLTTLSLVISISCFINSMVIAGLIWVVVTGIEYKNYLKLKNKL